MGRIHKTVCGHEDMTFFPFFVVGNSNLKAVEAIQNSNLKPVEAIQNSNLKAVETIQIHPISTLDVLKFDSRR